MNNIIPHKWEVKKFDEIFDVVTDYVANGSFASLRENVTYKNTEDYAILVRLQDYSNKFKKNFVYVDEHAYNFLSKSKLNTNDLVICNVGAAGIIFKVPDLTKPMTLGPNSILVRTNESSDYMYYYIQSSIGQQKLKDITTTTAQPKFNKTDFKSIKCSLPPLKEQQKIASILSSVDTAIEKTEQVIAKTEEVKKGLMQQLLTKGIGHTEFKQTEIGEIPLKWEAAEIGTLIQVQGGYAFKSKDAVDSGIRWFKIANVSVGNIKWDDVSYLPTSYSEIYKDYLLKERDFVVALTRPILNNELKIAQINKSDMPALLNQRVGRIRYKKEVNPRFIYYVMTSKCYIDEINSRILGTDPPNVSPKQLESILIQIPSIEEQLEIVAILENVDNKIKKEEDTLFKLNKLKQGLMQQLLTGQVRVKVD